MNCKMKLEGIMHYHQQYECPFYNSYYYDDKNATNNQSKRRRAVARITGGSLAPSIRGTVTFTEVPGGTVISVEVNGLPPYKPANQGKPQVGPHGFHIHESGNCSLGNQAEPFMTTGGHWNPTNQPHGNHAGDFPVLFSNGGYAKMTFFTNKFNVEQVIGKAIIIHEGPDDYKTQPAGGAGRRLACGVIEENV
jgi:superoxide dismutase, Cu-Zn family